MLYPMFDLNQRMMAGWGAWADWQARMIEHPGNPLGYSDLGSHVASALEVFAHATELRGKPAFGLASVESDGATLPVTEVVEAERPFGRLIRFSHDAAAGKPKLLIVAPMSGHFATLLRGTVERLIPGHEVWITDWADAREVPLAEGPFDLDDYIDYIVGWLGHIGPGAHVLAVCQPSVPALAAVALMNADNHPATPRTLTMMGGPVDTREAPTAVNTLATQRPHAWFAQSVIATVPPWYPGAGRRVYPGFLQLMGFMTMNLGSHMMSHWQMFRHLVVGDDDSADKQKDFYEEYRSVCDLPAEYYLQTIDRVFQRHALPKGEFFHRDRRVDVGAITRTALLAIEGEKDDISGIGQTKAALTIATGLADDRKAYHLADGAGHYGIFNGTRWRTRIAPVMEAWIARFEGEGTRNA